jgi:hypothetical protein
VEQVSETPGNPKQAARSVFHKMYEDRGCIYPYRSRRFSANVLGDLSHQNGYPRYSFIIGETPEFQNFRRFREARARVLLTKQDNIVQLEIELNQIDQDEKNELFLGNWRRDTNASRKSVLKKIDEALKDYGEFLLLSSLEARLDSQRLFAYAN